MREYLHVTEISESHAEEPGTTREVHVVHSCLIPHHLLGVDLSDVS